MRPSAQASAAPGDLALTLMERAQIALLYAGIAAATLLGFVGSFFLLPHYVAGQVGTGGLVFTGLAITAYVLGLRHGFDADHIAAIDNTTRKLLNEGQRPLTVGTWFSLGHSTIVTAMIALLVVATELVKNYYAALATTGAIVGTLISGVFLFVIGLVNVIIVLDVFRIFRGLRNREFDPAELDAQMERRGFLYRYFGRLFRVIRSPRQIYPIGLLFGLGFDTATEVLVISISVGFAATSPIPLWAVMLLPLLFTCGMVLSDTTDGFAMRYAYGWAFRHPIRKIYYNLTLTTISVLVAFVVGGVELLQVLSSEFGLSGPIWGWIDHLDFETLGIGIAILFVGTWALAMLIYRWKRFEEEGEEPSLEVPRRPPEGERLGARPQP